MQTIYLHIGTHKTGTTAIQSFSAQNISNLKHLGIYYPKLARPKNPGIASAHHLLPWYLMNHPVPSNFYGEFENKKESLIESLKEEIKKSNYDRIVISSEEFDCLNQNQIEKLKDLFIEFNIKIILYLRRKDTYIESMYQTSVMYFKEMRPILDMVNNMKMPLDYYDFVKRWQNVFGKENVLIKFYCKNSMINNNIVVDFYSHFNIDVAGIVKNAFDKEINKSIPAHYVAAIVTLRRMGVDEQFIDSVKNIAKMIGNKTTKHFHTLSIEKRIEFANSCFDEIKKLDLELPSGDCFKISKEEIAKTEKNGNYSALKRIFYDFENLLNEKNIE